MVSTYDVMYVCMYFGIRSMRSKNLTKALRSSEKRKEGSNHKICAAVKCHWLEWSTTALQAVTYQCLFAWAINAIHLAYSLKHDQPVDSHQLQYALDSSVKPDLPTPYYDLNH